jgi:hypothetical protein
MKIRKIILSAILMVPIVIAAANGFAPMEGTITYSWGNSIITSEVKSFTVNPPLVLFIGALVYCLYRSNLAFRAAPAISFLYSFLTLWLVWSGVSWDLFGVFYYAVIFAFIGLIGAIIAYLIHSLFLKLFSVRSKADE